MRHDVYQARAERLLEVNETIAKLDPAIRESAFALLTPYVTGDSPAPPTSSPVGEDPAAPRHDAVEATPADEGQNIESLIEKHLSDTDAENAMLMLAVLYMRHGRGPFELSALKEIAREFNVNIPARPDMTFASARRGDPPLPVVRKQAGGWKIMPAGEKWLKQTFGVTMGRA